MHKPEISARLNPLQDLSGPVKAMASVSIDNVIAINSLTIVEGENGTFVGFPQSKDAKGNYRDIVEFLKDDEGKMTKESAELKNAISTILIEMHSKNERQTPIIDKDPIMHEIKAFVTPLQNPKTATKGLATIQVGQLFKVNSIRVNESSKTQENFVAMPSRPDRSSDTGYRDVVHPVNKVFAEQLKGAVLKQYDSQIAWKNHTATKEQQPQQHEKPTTNKSQHSM